MHSTSDMYTSLVAEQGSNAITPSLAGHLSSGLRGHDHGCRVSPPRAGKEITFA